MNRTIRVFYLGLCAKSCVKVVLTAMVAAVCCGQVFSDEKSSSSKPVSKAKFIGQIPPEIRKMASNSSVGSFKVDKLKIVIDTSKSPQSADWAQNAQQVALEWYPNLVYLLGTPSKKNDPDTFTAPMEFTLEFKPMDGVAHAVGNRIVISEKWIKDRPDDIGMVVHEMVHVVQSYRKPVPGWITEGIADYIRFFVYEKNGDKTCRVNPDKAKYTDSYRTTGAFFDWIVRNKNPQFVHQLNHVCRKSGLPNDKIDETFERLAKNKPDELWSQFIESLKKR